MVQLAGDDQSHGAIMSHVFAIKFLCAKKGKRHHFSTRRLLIVICCIKNSRTLKALGSVITHEQLVLMWLSPL